jgi:hypothetical protein
MKSFHLTLTLLLVGASLSAQGASCPEPDTTAAWFRVIKAWHMEKPGAWTNDALRQRLLDLEREDQADRVDFGARWQDSIYGRQLLQADSARARALTAILDSVGFPRRSLVGAKGADAAMRIAQHNGQLQPRVFALAKALPRGEVSPEALAMMEDRLLVAQGKPQRYGSHFSGLASGKFALAPVEDPRQLAARRDSAGLMPLSLNVCMMNESGMQIDRSSLPPPERPAPSTEEVGGRRSLPRSAQRLRR